MDEEESSIERLKKSLYTRNEKLVPKEKRTPVSPHEVEAPPDWGGKRTFDYSPEVVIKRNNSFFNKFLIGSLVFFTLSLAIALFIFFGGLNMISSNNLTLEITAPSSVSSGEELDIGLTITNQNRTDLEEASLIIDYPEGAQSVGDNNKPLVHEKIDLGTIAKHDKTNYTVRALLFGDKDVTKTFNFRIEYKVKGSNAVFSKEKSFDVLIGSSPLLLNVSYPTQITSGDTITLKLEITSNSSVPIRNALVKIEYPYGFTYKTSNVKPLRSNSVWNIGDLKNGDKKTLTVTGVLIGQNQEDRSFRISAGTPDSGSNDFTESLAQTIVTLGIRKSFFDLGINLVGGTVVHPNENIQMQVMWENTLPDRVLNNVILVKLSGNAIDRSLISVNNGGFYRSGDDTITWDKNGDNDLQELSPGDHNQVTFSLHSLQDNLNRLVKNPHIDVNVVMTGDRSGTNVESISSVADYSVKISSTLTLVGKTYRSVGPFSNTGSIPPRVDKESTYTIYWSVSNTTNDLKNTLVTATLPPGAVWKNETSAGTGSISYDPDSRLVTWNIGNVSAGVGYSYPVLEAYFKVGLTPSANQVGSPAVVINESKLEALDTYSGNTLTEGITTLTTHYADPDFSTGKDNVTK